VAEYKKNAERLGSHIVFVDESGFMLAPQVRRTWAPKGKTPILRHRYKHDRISVISGLSISPGRKRFGIYFIFSEENLKGSHVADFLRYLLRHLRGKVIVVWDNAATHRGEPIRAMLRRFKRLCLEALPPYAPELNPAEGIWSQAKRSLANGRPNDSDELANEVGDALIDIGLSQSLLRACIKQSDLPFF